VSPLGAWTWLSGSRRTDLRTRLSPEQCFERLRDNADSLWTLFGTREVVGWVRPGRAQLRKRSFVRNSFRPWLRLTWEADGRFTAVVCRCGMSPWTVGFLAVWLGVLALLAVLMTVLVFTTDVPAVSLAAFPALILFVVLLLGLGRLISAGEAAFLLAWATRTLEAESAPT
jgi:hypothetical protein